MKLSSVLAFILLSNVALSQGGYFAAGMTSLTNNVFNPGFTFGGGYRHKSVGVGFVADFYGIVKDKPKYNVAALDLRAYLMQKNISPYFSLQPGVVLYDKTFAGITTKGHLAGSVCLGLDSYFKEEGPGMNLFVGYQYISFRTDKTYTSSSHNFKAGINFLLR
jgi:hypothetical protein